MSKAAMYLNYTQKKAKKRNRFHSLGWSLLLCLTLLACKSQPQTSEDPFSEQEFAWVLENLPDSMLHLSGAFQPELKLTGQGWSTLMETRQVEQSAAISFEVAEWDLKRGWMSLESRGSDNGLAYQVLLLRPRKGRRQAMVVRRVEDMCCAYGKLGWYTYSEAGLEEIRRSSRPTLDWNPFFMESTPPVPEQNSDGFPLFLELQANPPGLAMNLLPEYLFQALGEEAADQYLKEVSKKTVEWRWDPGKGNWNLPQ